MAKAMKLREVIRALQSHGCYVVTDDGAHTKWSCPCGGHSANIPRHRVVSPGVVRSTQQRMACLPKGWLG
jgi:predicted RNA binding protein YcfA (HicA-like mRNA interferase family)